MIDARVSSAIDIYFENPTDETGPTIVLVHGSSPDHRRDWDSGRALSWRGADT